MSIYYIARLEAQIAQLQKDNADLEADLEAERGYSSIVRGERNVLRVEVSELELEKMTARQPDTPNKTPDQKTILRLQVKVTKLEKEKAMNEPLIQIGVKVRLRLLNSAREAYKVNGMPDRHAAQEGNMVAHGGMARVDKLLFRNNLLSPERHKLYSDIFREIYWSSPHEHDSIPAIVVDTFDCEVTIRTLHSTNELSINKRSCFLAHVEYIKKAYKTMPNKDFLNDSGIQQRVNMIKDVSTLPCTE